MSFIISYFYFHEERKACCYRWRGRGMRCKDFYVIWLFIDVSIRKTHLVFFLLFYCYSYTANFPGYSFTTFRLWFLTSESEKSIRICFKGFWASIVMDKLTVFFSLPLKDLKDRFVFSTECERLTVVPIIFIKKRKKKHVKSH